MIWRGMAAVAVALVCVLHPAALEAQSVRLSMDGLRDDIPATHVALKLEAVSQPLPSLYLTLGGRHLRIDQEAAQGLPRFDETLQSAWVEAAVLFGQMAAVTGRLGLNRNGDGGTDAEYLVRGQYAVPFGTAPHPVVTTFSLEAARAREVAVAAALAHDIVYDRLAGGLDLRLGQRVSGAARLIRDSYSDDNRKLQGYAYGLLELVSAPSVSVGYAWSFADSDVDNWRRTGSTFDSATQIYEYRYFYFPYFTPQAERGHSALAMFNWAAPGGAKLAASANIPIVSRGQLQNAPQWGTTPEPPVYGYYTATGILPLQAGVSASLPLLPRLSGAARYDWFRKPYYSYHAGGVSLQVTF
jgi:hypothetical protein